MARSVARSTFDPAVLLKPGTTLFLQIPPDQLEAQKGLLRCWISTLVRMIGAAGDERAGEVLFLSMRRRRWARFRPWKKRWSAAAPPASECCWPIRVIRRCRLPSRRLAVESPHRSRSGSCRRVPQIHRYSRRPEPA